MSESMDIKCEGCHSTEFVVSYPGRSHEVLCPRCAALLHNGEIAAEHLASLMREILPAWAGHWRQRGLERDSLINIFNEGALFDHLRPEIDEMIALSVDKLSAHRQL